MTIAADWPSPAYVLDYYRRSREALAALRQNIASSADSQSLFYQMTDEEVEQALRQMATELDHEVTLLLTASFEAIFQVDFLERVAKKRKEPVSRRMRALRKRHKNRRILFEEILDLWQKQTGSKGLIGQLKQLIQFRHWLAHGRYWVQKSGLEKVDPLEAWTRGTAVFDSLPGFDPMLFG